MGDDDEPDREQECGRDGEHDNEPDGRVGLPGLLVTALVRLGVEAHFLALLAVDDADALTVAQARQILLGLTSVNPPALQEATTVVTQRLARNDDRVVGRARATLEREQSHNREAGGPAEHAPGVLPTAAGVTRDRLRNRRPEITLPANPGGIQGVVPVSITGGQSSRPKSGWWNVR